MCTMKICSRCHVLLWFIYITIPVFEAQEVKVEPEVTGYLGQDVTLPCQFIPGPRGDNITQFQWDLETPEGEKISIIVFSVQFGVMVPESFLKERVEIAEQSLIIRNVEMGDAGSYTCSFSTFPFGSSEGTTKLVVREAPEAMPILLRMIAAGVFVLIVVTMLATTYFIIIRIRRGTSVRQRVCMDTDGTVMCD